MTRYTLLALSLTLPVYADTALDGLARDVDRAESVRAVKTLQSSYAQYAQYGLWNEVGALFAPGGSLLFDGLIKEAQTAKGSAAIATFLRTRYGGGEQGLTAGSLSSMFLESAVVNLSLDGESAKARFQSLIFHGHGGKARIEGGIFENDYMREQGVWKIATVHFFPQYEGPYEEGWTNWGGGDLPLVPKHFTTEQAGVPILPATGTAPATKLTLAALQTRVDVLNDEDRVRNLQSAYGYYADRKMWDDVVDLFAQNGVVEIAGQGIWRGPAGVRHWLESIGSAGLKHGQLNDRVQANMIVTITPGGNEAFARGHELGMLGEADQEKGWWEVATFYNRFVKEDGLWKIREMRRFPIVKSDIFLGWGRSHIVDPVPTGANAPDAPIPAADKAEPGLAMPAFAAVHPVTGKAVKAAGSAKLVAVSVLTGAIAAGKATSITIEEARRRLARSAAYDGAANMAATYGYHLDDGETLGFSNTMAAQGFKESPFSGFSIGRDSLIKARVRGPAPTQRAGISYHWLIQPVVLVSDDGRSATGRFRLFQPRTGKATTNSAFWGGMYQNRYVLEEGIWRHWELTLDEPYITPVAWKDGVWAKSKDPAPRPANAKAKAKTAGNINVDVPLTSLGKREEHFSGGTGETWQWPTILPMWFAYTNPVSGRVPEFYEPNCVPCAVRPELSLSRNGYQEPPDAHVANKSR
jgi:hypothetical protein